jgi:tRNA-specific 2-thiouridylase
MKEVVLGLSGGVDSAVSAFLLQKAGYRVHGLYLDIGSAAARADAGTVAAHFGIDLRVEDVSAALEREVCAPFAASYLRGETPNPCILCNPAVKFRALLRFADALGGAAIATGHYAVAENGRLYRGRSANDQSYMLCRLTREQLSRLILPLGGSEKTQVRALAAELGLPTAHKPDSMEICFIPDKNYVNWLSQRAALPGPGDFVFHGELIGRHEGLFRWTVGQRVPGLYGGRKLYVGRIDAADNTIELALWDELFRTEVTARDFNWLIDEPTGPIRASVRVRHTKWENPPCSAAFEDGLVRIVCDEPVRAPAPGQSAVLYDGDRLLGGGFITG